MMGTSTELGKRLASGTGAIGRKRRIAIILIELPWKADQ